MSDRALKTISPDDLLPLDDYEETHPLTVDLVYAAANNPDNIFGENIYRAEARLWLHRDFLPIILRAAEICFAASGHVFEVKDGLRTVEAQARMMETDIVKAHPEWTQEPDRMLAPPGMGAHPRGMAVDIVLRDRAGKQVDMGTGFDHLTKTNNPSARDYAGFSPQVLENRKILERAMLQAAQEAGRKLLPLPQEWWDFRFPRAETELFAPLHDADLPEEMRMT